MTDMSEFSPCPFCGGTDLEITYFSTGVRCRSCGMTSVAPGSSCAGKKENRIRVLISKWNQRA